MNSNAMGKGQNLHTQTHTNNHNVLRRTQRRVVQYASRARKTSKDQGRMNGGFCLLLLTTMDALLPRSQICADKSKEIQHGREHGRVR